MWSTPRFLIVPCCAMLLALQGCAVVTVAGAVAGAAVSVGGAVVSTGVKVTGKVVEKTIDAVTPSSSSE
jgi:hypothetical protein